MKYQVVEERQLLDLCKRVSQLLTEGWKLVGGVAVVHSTNSGASYYYQALTKE